MFIKTFALAFLALMVADTADFALAGFVSCPANESYLPCGPACPLTCSTLVFPPVCLNNRCYPGCYCNPGYYRNGRRTCVPLAQCS